jgi:hypothetical protein
MENYNNFAETFSKSRINLKWSEIDYFLDFIGQSIINIDEQKVIKILDV